MLNRKTTQLYSLTLCTIMLAVGCSSSDGDSVTTNENGKIDVYYGLVDVYGEPDSPDVLSYFRKTEMDRQTFELFKEQSALYVDDTEKCQILREDIPSPFSTFDLSDKSLNWEYITSGEVILLSSDAGSYAELVPVVDEDFISYEVSGEDPPGPVDRPLLPVPVPVRLNITVPGDDFPAVNGISLLKPTRLTGKNLNFRDAVSLDTVFTWDPGDVGHVLLGLNASGLGSEYSVYCKLTDDGSFFLPDSTIQELITLIGEDGVVSIRADGTADI